MPSSGLGYCAGTDMECSQDFLSRWGSRGWVHQHEVDAGGEGRAGLAIRQTARGQVRGDQAGGAGGVHAHAGACASSSHAWSRFTAWAPGISAHLFRCK